MPIGRIGFNIESSRYLKELVKRQADFINKSIVAKIVVPDDLRFWYWL